MATISPIAVVNWIQTESYLHFTVNSDRRNSIETAKNTNPGYDALLCTRLYPEVPSTPPPLPKKLRTHRRTNSDSSMNTSVTAPTSPEVAPGTPASPSEAVIASRLTSHLMQQPRPTFCPLCPGYFYSQSELRDHLVQAHSDDLSLIKKNLKHFKKETCPCCEAEFLKVKHNSLVSLRKEPNVFDGRGGRVPVWS